MIVGIAGVRWELIPLQFALLAAGVSALVLFIFGLILLPVVLFKLVLRKPLTSGSLTRCILGLFPVAILLFSVGPAGLSSPAIHDISTDTNNPPFFVLATEQRVTSDNSVEYEGEALSSLQQEAYPDIKPLTFPEEPRIVVEAVTRVILEKDWAMLLPWAEIWYLFVSGVFLQSYRETSKGTSFVPADDGQFMVLLRAFVLEKAVYELMYELNNRPQWVDIPLYAIKLLLKD